MSFDHYHFERSMDEETISTVDVSYAAELDTSSMNNDQTCGFLRLPVEIRRKIYAPSLRRGWIHVPHNLEDEIPWTKSMEEKLEKEPPHDKTERIFPPRSPGILSVSKQISEEALDLLYGSNLFIICVSAGAHANLLSFGSVNIQRIRRLQLIIQPTGAFYPDALYFDSRIWTPLLKDLNQLRLVLQQPLKVNNNRMSAYDNTSYEEKMREWVYWLDPVLRFLYNNCESTTNVEIDDNALLETSKLVDECFPFGYNRVHTAIGDTIFRRGAFSDGPVRWVW